MAAAVLLAALAAAPARAEETGYLTFALGAFDVDDSDRTVQGEIQWRPGWTLWVVQPMLGLMATGDGAVYGYAGASIDIRFGRVVLRPSLAVGAFEEGDGKDLGNTVEFRTGVELAWEFENRMRLGVEFSHISNAGLGDSNPGANSLMLLWSVPTARLFGG